jgi:hypothetical protein
MDAAAALKAAADRRSLAPAAAFRNFDLELPRVSAK